jgi:hypothetical protein
MDCKRLSELGIRIALGASRKEVLHAALGRPFKWTLGVTPGKLRAAFSLYAKSPMHLSRLDK